MTRQTQGSIDLHRPVVVGTDGSDSATYALRQAAALAKSAGVPLHVVSAYEPVSANERRRDHRLLPDGIDLPCTDGNQAHARDLLLDAEHDLGIEGVNIHAHAVAGEPAQALCQVAERTRAGLIVVGNRGIASPTRRVRRPLCDRVQHRANCSVLVVDTERYWRPIESRSGIHQAIEPSASRQWLTLAVTAVAVFMAMLDVTIVNVAFPSIQHTFSSTSIGDLSWVLNAYNVAVAALLVPAGRLADRFGRRRAFFAGLWVFLLGSVMCGAAGSAEMLIAARVVQAAGAAVLIPSSLGLVIAAFPVEKRALATSLWAAAGAVAAAAGPSLGGLLVESHGWRWCFFVNLAVALAVIPGRKILVEGRDEESAAAPDIVGGTLLASGVGLLALGIVKAPEWGWTGDRTLAAWAAAVAAIAFLLSRSKRHPSPVLERELLDIRLFTQANAAFFIFSAGFYALLLCNVLFLTEVWHYPILTAGFAVTPGPIAAAVAAAIGGKRAEHSGPRSVAIPATLLFAVACLMYRELATAEPSYVTHWLPAQIVSGTSIGLTVAALTTASIMDLPPNRLATGTALTACSRQVGAVFGIAVLIAVIGTPSPAEALGRFDEAWLLMAMAALSACAVALRFSARRPGEGPVVAPVRERSQRVEVAGMEQRFVTIHGERLAYRIAGSGPPILLVHGLLESSTTWRKLAPALALNHTVIAPDLLGHGDSGGTRDCDYSPAGHAGRLRDLVDELGYDRVTVVGHSLGAGIAMAFAYHYPARVKRIALMSAGGLGSEVSRVLRYATLPGAGPLVRALGSAPVRLFARGISSLARLFGARAVARGLQALLATFVDLGDASRRGAFLRSARAVIDVRGQCVSGIEHFRNLTHVPTLIVWGTRDRVIPVAHARRAAEINPDAEVVLLDGVGHHPHLSQAAFVAERMMAFVGAAGDEAGTALGSHRVAAAAAA
jgi:EmrB/QacA subfamily drug resistance transporter